MLEIIEKILQEATEKNWSNFLKKTIKIIHILVLIKKYIIRKVSLINLIFNHYLIYLHQERFDLHRHCELVTMEDQSLPEPDCKIAPGSFEYMYNCIFYKTEIQNETINVDLNI